MKIVQNTKLIYETSCTANRDCERHHALTADLVPPARRVRDASRLAVLEAAAPEAASNSFRPQLPESSDLEKHGERV